MSGFEYQVRETILPRRKTIGLDYMSAARAWHSVGAALLVVCTTFLPLSSGGQVAPRSLSKDEVITLLKGDVSPKRVAELAHERGVDFQVTAEAEKELRQAGADDSLLAALRNLAPTPAAVSPANAALKIESSPGGAQVFVDDVLIARTSQEGRLVIPSLSAGKHHVRISLEGYRDWERDLELGAAQTASLAAKLETAKPVVPPRLGPPATISALPGQSDVTQFELWHSIGLHRHRGILTIFPGGITWAELGPDARPADNFSMSCSNIIDVSRESCGEHIRTGSESYTLCWPERKSPSKRSKRLSKEPKGLSDPSSFGFAISAACPGVLK